jgi:hypothetical protein
MLPDTTLLLAFRDSTGFQQQITLWRDGIVGFRS